MLPPLPTEKKEVGKAATYKTFLFFCQVDAFPLLMVDLWFVRLFILCLPLQLVLPSKSKSKSIELPALGRPFALGDLYNLKDDQVIPGPKLWQSDQLANYTESIMRETHFEVMASENLQGLQNFFDISAWLALSFMGGLVSVKGSAGYLDDRVKTSNMARVSLKFDTRTFKRSLKGELFVEVDVLKQRCPENH